MPGVIGFEGAQHNKRRDAQRDGMARLRIRTTKHLVYDPRPWPGVPSAVVLCPAGSRQYQRRWRDAPRHNGRVAWGSETRTKSSTKRTRKRGSPASCIKRRETGRDGWMGPVLGPFGVPRYMYMLARTLGAWGVRYVCTSSTRTPCIMPMTIRYRDQQACGKES